MSAKHLALADAVTAALATLGTGVYTPVRAYLPDWTEKNTADLQCNVVPSNVETVIADRAGEARTYTIDVGFVKRLADQTRDEIDALALIVEAAFDYLAPSGAGNAYTVGSVRYRSMLATYKAIYDPDKLAAKADGAASGTFLSVFTITYRARA